MYQDPEIFAMNQVLDSMKSLNNWQRKRIVDWAVSRFKLEEADSFTPVEVEPVPTPAVQAVSVPAPEVEPAPVVAAPEAAPDPEPVAETPVQEAKTEEAPPADFDNKGVALFDSELVLFTAANVKTISARILLMGAYMHLKLGYKDFSSYEINSRLKSIGYGAPNIASSINAVAKRKPPVLLVLGEGSHARYAKRKFKLTEAGLKLANTYLD